MSTNESDVSFLIQIMSGIDQFSLNIAFAANEGFPVLLEAMTQWENSVTVQEKGCVLLAEIYFHLPYPTDATGTVQGPWATQNQREALSCVHRAMDSNRDVLNIQLHGCLAILNLLHPVSETDINSLDRQAMSSIIELSYKVVLECLQTHESDTNVQINGIAALAVSISVSQVEDFESWASRIVRQLSYSLSQFTGNYTIQALALHALIVVQDIHGSMKPEYRSSDIDILLTLVGCDNSEISGRSSTILSSILRNNPETSNQIEDCQDYIERILSCLVRLFESETSNLIIP